MKHLDEDAHRRTKPHRLFLIKLFKRRVEIAHLMWGKNLLSRWCYTKFDRCRPEVPNLRYAYY